LYDELSALLSLPKSEFDVQYAAFKQRTQAAQPLSAVLIPAIDQLLAKEHRSQARLAMLLAAIAVEESGPEALKDLKDPFGDGPFAYEAWDNGFELKSKLLFENDPVTLTVGTRKK
jgi:hypothetical protein